MSEPQPILLEVREVSKSFGATLAVDRASFTIRAGEVVGFLGPNGAGKSTLLKLIATFLAPDAGTITVAGRDVRRDSLGARERLGYLAEHNALYDGMRVQRYLRFVGLARGLDGARLADRTAWTIDACALGAVVRKRIHECSKGYRQRIGLAAALIHDPPVIVLDEPTHGLDPLQMAAFRDFLGRLAGGRAILFSSHIVSEVCESSARVIAIRGGRIVADRATRELDGEARAAGITLDAHLVLLLAEPPRAA